MRPEYKEVDIVDLLKIKDALAEAIVYFRKKDEMNAQMHLAKTVRESPLSSSVAGALYRLEEILK